MKRTILTCFAFCVVLTASSVYASWSFNTNSIDGVEACTYFYHEPVGDGQIFLIQCNLNSNGSAGTNIDIWKSFQENARVNEAYKKILGNGGVLRSVCWHQGATWNGVADFTFKLYDGKGHPIFNETFDYNEAGQGVTGGCYSGNLTKGQYPAVKGGLTLDNGDIGNSGDNIITIFEFYIRNWR